MNVPMPVRLLALPLLLASCGGLLGSPSTTDPLRSEDADVQFMASAASSNLFEIQTSQLALTKSTSSAVKAYAQRMIDEHNTAQAALAALATSRGIVLPTQPAPAQRSVRDRLAAFPDASGGAATTLFDQLYGKAQLDGHQLTLDVFNAYLRTPSADDEGVKGYATTNQPIILMHRDDARNLPQPPSDATPLSR
ncbi:DUF4142 domain-containing protein [Deinococcus pimensis]|uniref:DUF4142 domain-containing protein n=1 Tax=Deinococcus pimensis TaxID=309888 RepID=UPI0004B0079D|nr:DUF4142 domain-containing protein [Deinococcus pimensis]